MNDKTIAEVLSKFNLEQITVLDQACEAKCSGYYARRSSDGGVRNNGYGCCVR